MDQQLREKEENLICPRHKKKVEWLIIRDNSIPFSDTIRCSRCIEEKPIISNNIIDLSQAKIMIKERYQNLVLNESTNKQRILKQLHIYLQKVTDTRSRFIKTIDKILGIIKAWVTSLEKTVSIPDQGNLLFELEQLYLNSKIKEANEDLLEKMTQENLIKIDQAFQQLYAFDEFQQCQKYLKSMDILIQKSVDQLGVLQYLKFKVSRKKIKDNSHDEVKVNSLKPINYKLIHSVLQSEFSYAIKFNNNGSIMVAGCAKDIKVWKFDGENLVEKLKLEGHTANVYCLAFSKMCNWFASGSDDNTIRCWKEESDSNWISSSPYQQHTNKIVCLILSRDDVQLISGSGDATIKVWDVNYENNQIEFAYTLENQHSDLIYCLSINESGTALVSCDADRKIILWKKGSNGKWQYQNHVCKNDFGRRICFISDGLITWQQNRENSTLIFGIEDGQLIEKPELKIILKEQTEDTWFFPTIFNNKKQIIIQKYGRCVYIIRKQSDGKLKIESEPIEFKLISNFGTLSEDGEFLVIWNSGTREFRVYKITY